MKILNNPEYITREYVDDENLSKEAELMFENPITSIEQEAFAESTCSKLIFKSEVGIIENNAFFSCKYLRSVSFEDYLGSLYFSAFEDCSNLDEFNHKTINTIHAHAFYNCGLKEVDMSNISRISSLAFAYNNIKTVKINDNIRLDDNVFADNPLKKVVIDCTTPGDFLLESGCFAKNTIDEVYYTTPILYLDAFEDASVKNFYIDFDCIKTIEFPLQFLTAPKIEKILYKGELPKITDFSEEEHYKNFYKNYKSILESTSIDSLIATKKTLRDVNKVLKHIHLTFEGHEKS